MVTNNEIFVFAIYYYNIIGLLLVDSKIRIPEDRWFTEGGYMSNNRITSCIWPEAKPLEVLNSSR